MSRELVFAASEESVVYDELPLPGSVSGPRVIRLLLDPGDFRPDVLVEELHRTLGFSKSTTGWKYDRVQALNWFLDELKAARPDWNVALYVPPPPPPPPPVVVQPRPTPTPTPVPAPPPSGGGGGRPQGPPSRTR